MTFMLEKAQMSIAESKGFSLDDQAYLTKENEADVFTIAAMFAANRDNVNLSSVDCSIGSGEVLKSHPKYRSFDGYGNNLKRPDLGNTNTPFARFGPKNYFDGIYSFRKSYRNSHCLPNARKIVENVLFKAAKAVRSSNIPNLLFLSLFSNSQFDVALPKSRRTSDGKIIQCCTSGSKSFLPNAIANPFCIGIGVSKYDPFYQNFGVGCLSQVRSQIISSPTKHQFGEFDSSKVVQGLIFHSVQVRSRTQHRRS